MFMKLIRVFIICLVSVLSILFLCNEDMLGMFDFMVMELDIFYFFMGNMDYMVIGCW